jgi:hypothetical protein
MLVGCSRSSVAVSLLAAILVFRFTIGPLEVIAVCAATGVLARRR